MDLCKFIPNKIIVGIAYSMYWFNIYYALNTTTTLTILIIHQIYDYSRQNQYWLNKIKNISIYYIIIICL